MNRAAVYQFQKILYKTKEKTPIQTALKLENILFDKLRMTEKTHECSNNDRKLVNSGATYVYLLYLGVKMSYYLVNRDKIFILHIVY